jgi:hypothetical protein
MQRRKRKEYLFAEKNNRTHFTKNSRKKELEVFLNTKIEPPKTEE